MKSTYDASEFGRFLASAAFPLDQILLHSAHTRDNESVYVKKHNDKSVPVTSNQCTPAAVGSPRLRGPYLLTVYAGLQLPVPVQLYIFTAVTVYTGTVKLRASVP